MLKNPHPLGTGEATTRHFNYSAAVMHHLRVSAPISLLLSQSGHGIFNTRNTLAACCAHETASK